jgi:hypothetical protein
MISRLHNLSNQAGHSEKPVLLKPKELEFQLK